LYQEKSCPYVLDPKTPRLVERCEELHKGNFNKLVLYLHDQRAQNIYLNETRHRELDEEIRVAEELSDIDELLHTTNVVYEENRITDIMKLREVYNTFKLKSDRMKPRSGRYNTSKNGKQVRRT